MIKLDGASLFSAVWSAHPPFDAERASAMTLPTPLLLPYFMAPHSSPIPFLTSHHSSHDTSPSTSTSTPDFPTSLSFARVAVDITFATESHIESSLHYPFLFESSTRFPDYWKESRRKRRSLNHPRSRKPPRTCAPSSSNSSADDQPRASYHSTGICPQSQQLYRSQI